MSRIFEALQRSEFERSGTRFPQSSGLATELLQAAESDTNPSEPFQSQSVHVNVPSHSRLVSFTDKASLGAEKFRFLGVRLRQIQQARPLKNLLITSTIPEEGKSMVSANLAITLARKHQLKVLLLEGDLRRPVLAQQFGLELVQGLSEWLQSDSRAVPTIFRLDRLGFWFLPAGHPPDNPLELMQLGRLAELMEQLTAWFDWVILDSPPVLPLADTSVWMRLADGVLLVAREGKTEKRELQRGLEVLDQSKLLGVVWNSCSSTDHKNYYQRYGPVLTHPQGEPRPEGQ